MLNVCILYTVYIFTLIREILVLCTHCLFVFFFNTRVVCKTRRKIINQPIYEYGIYTKIYKKLYNQKDL